MAGDYRSSLSFSPIIERSRPGKRGVEFRLSSIQRSLPEDRSVFSIHTRVSRRIRDEEGENVERVRKEARTREGTELP
jgi:hypothetical protein